MIYNVGISWTVADTYPVEANSIEEAFAWAKEHIDEIPCTSEAEYVSDTFFLDGYVDWYNENDEKDFTWIDKEEI